jgi:two-component system, NtrC family, sensor kinase
MHKDSITAGEIDSAIPKPAGPAAPRQARQFMVSIRTKGLVVFTALIVYCIVIAIFAFHQKGLLLTDFEEMQSELETEAMLKQADVATFDAVMVIITNNDALDHAAGVQAIDRSRQSLVNRNAALRARLPQDTVDLTDLNASLEVLAQDSSRTNLRHTLYELSKVKERLANLATQMQERRARLSERYRARSNSVAMTTFLLGMLGLGLLGAIIGLFFRRLTDDLRVLQGRALAIVKGFRGEPMAVTRHDEVGQLMGAVNTMAETLDSREKELLLERQKYFHQEKMAAIGALAAGITHEIGNPIAAISGIAEEMVARRDAAGLPCDAAACHDCRPELIAAQTQRLAAITREIAEFASPRSAEPQLLDLNAQLRSTASLIRYDRRLERVTLRLDLDSQLPAIYGVGDQLTQLIMNLVINAVDALDSVHERTPTVIITTGVDAEQASMVVEDNGEGIAEDTLGRVFEAFFTTKPAGKGTGLGLSLCYAIAKRHGGTIEIASTVGVGTRVQVFFPLNDTSYSEANSV